VWAQYRAAETSVEATTLTDAHAETCAQMCSSDEQRWRPSCRSGRHRRPGDASASERPCRRVSSFPGHGQGKHLCVPDSCLNPLFSPQDCVATPRVYGLSPSCYGRSEHVCAPKTGAPVSSSLLELLAWNGKHWCCLYSLFPSSLISHFRHAPLCLAFFASPGQFSALRFPCLQQHRVALQLCIDRCSSDWIRRRCWPVSHSFCRSCL